MADFTPKKVSGEKGKAKAGEGKPMDSTEHMAPPTIHLGHEHLKALGLHKGPMPKIGSKIKISGLVHVGSHSESDDSESASSRAEGTGATTPKSTRHMTLHLHKMDMAHDGTSDEEKSESQKAGMKGAIDEALSRGEGGRKDKDAEGTESKLGKSDNAPRGSNGPGARA